MEKILETKEKVLYRLPIDVIQKLNCVGSLGNAWYIYCYIPMSILVDTIIDVLKEEPWIPVSYSDYVRIVNEITGLGFCNDGVYKWDEGDDKLAELFGCYFF